MITYVGQYVDIWKWCEHLIKEWLSLSVKCISFICIDTCKYILIHSTGD